jgi:hypothetical protein
MTFIDGRYKTIVLVVNKIIKYIKYFVSITLSFGKAAYGLK